jgi:hypothetical protein
MASKMLKRYVSNLTPPLGLRPRLTIWTLLHYAACALGITIGFLGFGLSALIVLFEVNPEVPFGSTIYWLAVGLVFAWELMYRPPTSVTAGIGAIALLLLFAWLGANVLVALAS